MAVKTIFMALILLQTLNVTVDTFFVSDLLGYVVLEWILKPTITKAYCPDNGQAVNGKWRMEEKNDVIRCILDCNEGYSPYGCHVIRKDVNGKWNKNIPTCEKDNIGSTDEGFSKKKLACYAAIGGAIAASPYILSALGFGSAGIAAGSIAAKWMSYIGVVSKGSLFAWLQSLGMKGIDLSPEAMQKMFDSIGDVCVGVIDIFSDCESE